MDPLWVGLVDVHPAAPGGLLGDERTGAYVYCAGHAPDLAAFITALGAAAATAQLELVGVDWLAADEQLPEPTRASEPVRDVVAAAREHGGVALDHLHTYPADDDPDARRLDGMRTRVETLAAGWIDGAIDRFDGAFELGPCAVVAELVFADETQVGWACTDPDATALLRRALDAAQQRDAG